MCKYLSIVIKSVECHKFFDEELFSQVFCVQFHPYECYALYIKALSVKFNFTLTSLIFTLKNVIASYK